MFEFVEGADGDDAAYALSRLLVRHPATDELEERHLDKRKCYIGRRFFSRTTGLGSPRLLLVALFLLAGVCRPVVVMSTVSTLTANVIKAPEKNAMKDKTETFHTRTK
ncbi:unnamed protein product [Notodromas monacha]|uniref:Uncharacterized protein n=1 Tax=Notodromas monacha TaxID=399045 RepID=A0A7R9GH27_9CRUS|nr:unnamed protein product [Notodromas monacha]CAG0921045.1 unnamed protein product [Notodromas monacha]